MAAGRVAAVRRCRCCRATPQRPAGARHLPAGVLRLVIEYPLPSHWHPTTTPRTPLQHDANVPRQGAPCHQAEHCGSGRRLPRPLPHGARRPRAARISGPMSGPCELRASARTSSGPCQRSRRPPARSTGPTRWTRRARRRRRRTSSGWATREIAGASSRHEHHTVSAPARDHNTRPHPRVVAPLPCLAYAAPPRTSRCGASWRRRWTRASFGRLAAPT